MRPTRSTFTIWVGNGYIDSTRNTMRGLQDVAICKKIIGNCCYVRYMGGQLEQVLEDAVALSFLPDMDAVDNAVIALREAGIMGALSIRIESIDGEIEELKIIPAEFEPARRKDMKRWNGVDASGQYQYPQDEINYWKMTIDERGTVYYIPHDGRTEPQVWCPASILTRHMHRLEQIAARH